MGASRTKCIVDDCEHLVRAHQHIIVPEPQHLIAKLMQPLRPCNVTRGIEVLTAIDFDDQLGFETGEIHDVRTDRKLTPKPKTSKLPAPQMMP